MSIESMFKSKQAILGNTLSTLITHPVAKGDNNEKAWIDFFRSFLPSKFAVDKGFVFDSKGNPSEEIDVIIYDALYTPLIYETNDCRKYITAESIYAVFESKPKIEKRTLEYTNRKVSSVNKLFRTSREIIDAGEVKHPRDLTNIIGGILAIDAIKTETIKSHLAI